MNLCPNPTGIPDGKFWGLLSMLNSDGGMAFTPQTCKETTLYFIGTDIAINFEAMTYGHGDVNGRIDQKNPGFIMWARTDNGFPSIELTIERIEDAISMLCEKMGLGKPSVQLLENTTNAIVVFFPPHFLSSPPAMHGFMTFIRGAARTKHNTSSIYKFLDSMDALWKNRGNIACADAFQLHEAERNGNLNDFLNKHFECDRLGYNDWLVRRDPYQDKRFNRFSWNGIVGYTNTLTHPKREMLDKQDIISVYGAYNAVRRPPGEYYSGWECSYLANPAKKTKPVAAAWPSVV